MSGFNNDDLLSLGMQAAKTEAGQKVANAAADAAKQQAKKEAKDQLLYDLFLFSIP